MQHSCQTSPQEHIPPWCNSQELHHRVSQAKPYSCHAQSQKGGGDDVCVVKNLLIEELGLTRSLLNIPEVVITAPKELVVGGLALPATQIEQCSFKLVVDATEGRTIRINEELAVLAAGAAARRRPNPFRICAHLATELLGAHSKEPRRSFERHERKRPQVSCLLCSAKAVAAADVPLDITMPRGLPSFPDSSLGRKGARLH